MSDYPFILGYTRPDGTQVRIRIRNEEESEEEYEKMFSTCGQDIRFSVDLVHADLIETEQYLNELLRVT
jgi:hypothetical protein